MFILEKRTYELYVLHVGERDASFCIYMTIMNRERVDETVVLTRHLLFVSLSINLLVLTPFQHLIS